MFIDKIEKFVDIPVDYYIMEGIEKLVDAVGKVNNLFEFTLNKTTFSKGKQKLYGTLVLKYSCGRYEDPTVDYGCFGMTTSGYFWNRETSFEYNCVKKLSIGFKHYGG